MNKKEGQQKVNELFKEGNTKTEIAKELGVTRMTIQRDLSNVPLAENVPNVPLYKSENVPLESPKETKDFIWRMRLGKWEQFKRYKKIGQKYLTKENIKEMVLDSENINSEDWEKYNSRINQENEN